MIVKIFGLNHEAGPVLTYEGPYILPFTVIQGLYVVLLLRNRPVSALPAWWNAQHASQVVRDSAYLSFLEGSDPGAILAFVHVDSKGLDLGPVDVLLKPGHVLGDDLLVDLHHTRDLLDSRSCASVDVQVGSDMHVCQEPLVDVGDAIVIPAYRFLPILLWEMYVRCL